MKKQHFIANVIVNVTICLLLIVVAFVGMGEQVVNVSSNNKAIYQGNPNEPNVSLMFNVYWGTEYIEPILKVLNSYEVKTTFFIGGSWAVKHNEVLREIFNNGHEIGSHGYSHKNSSELTYKQNVDEIRMADAIIEKILGFKPSLFAPPSGSIGIEMFKACDDLGKNVIMWTRDTIDWRDKDSSMVLKRATMDIQNGSFILMHPTEHTLKALPLILDSFKQKGVRVTTVSNCLKESVV